MDDLIENLGLEKEFEEYHFDVDWMESFAYVTYQYTLIDRYGDPLIEETSGGLFYYEWDPQDAIYDVYFSASGT